MKTIIATVLGMTALCGSALASGHVQKWQGSGAAYTPAGVKLETYHVSVVNTKVAAKTIQSEAIVISADGTRKVITQTLSIEGANWSVESNLGKGGGACYGKGICENYISGSDGMAYATTIISDSANTQRQVTTVLQNGKAVKMLRQNMVRVQ